MYIYNYFLASSNEREREVGRIHDKQCLLANFCCAVFVNMVEVTVGPESCKGPAVEAEPLNI